MNTRISKIDLPGTCFRAVFIPNGETPENFPAAKDNYDLIEFYDRDYDHTPDGQFVTRYRAETLLARDPIQGLCLMGHEPKWNIKQQDMETLYFWMLACTQNTEREEVEA